MKILTLIRHAKSDWDQPVTDFQRPLNKRGRHDAPLMGNILREKGRLPEKIYISDARRTRETAALLNGELKLPEDRLEYFKELYLASVPDIIRIVQNTPDSLNHIAVIAHNPGISAIACRLSGRRDLSFPTCGMARLHFETDCWIDFDAVPASFEWFEYPKKYK